MFISAEIFGLLTSAHENWLLIPLTGRLPAVVSPFGVCVLIAGLWKCAIWPTSGLILSKNVLVETTGPSVQCSVFIAMACQDCAILRHPGTCSFLAQKLGIWSEVYEMLSYSSNAVLNTLSSSCWSD